MKRTNTQQFLSNKALNYLCRHVDFENICLRDFVEQLETKNVSKKNDEKKGTDEYVYPFQPKCGPYTHPSIIKTGKRKGTCGEGNKYREENGYCKVPQWLFPDTASFRGNCLECPVEDFQNSMEVHAQLVLCLFLPHRKKEDLCLQDGAPFPYLRKLRNIYESDSNEAIDSFKKIFKKRNINLLTNIQNCRANSLRYKFSGDELKTKTEAFNPTKTNGDENNIDEDDEEEDDIVETSYDQIMGEVRSGTSG